MDEQLTVDKTLMTMNGRDGDVFAIVTFMAPALGCGIARNGAPLPDHHWPIEEIAACTAALLRLAGVKS